MGETALKLEVARRLPIRIPALRMKQLTTKLSAAEQQELDTMLQVKAEAYPESTRQQYAETVRLTAIRNFTFTDVRRKPSLLQKLTKQQTAADYEITFDNENQDVATYDIDYKIALEVRQVMEDIGLAMDWPKMLPVEHAMNYTDRFDEEEKEWFQSFPEPAWCARKLQESKQLEEKAVSKGKALHECISWLITHWNNDFQIYADIDPEL